MYVSVHYMLWFINDSYRETAGSRVNFSLTHVSFSCFLQTVYSSSVIWSCCADICVGLLSCSCYNMLRDVLQQFLRWFKCFIALCVFCSYWLSHKVGRFESDKERFVEMCCSVWLVIMTQYEQKLPWFHSVISSLDLWRIYTMVGSDIFVDVAWAAWSRKVGEFDGN